MSDECPICTRFKENVCSVLDDNERCESLIDDLQNEEIEPDEFKTKFKDELGVDAVEKLKNIVKELEDEYD